MMMTRHASLRTILSAGLAAIAITGCGSMSASSGSSSQKVENYEARLSGTQEVPANTSTGSGIAEFQLNRDTNLLTWKITYSGLSGAATAGHIHGPAAAGQNAGVLVPFSSVGTQPITGQTTITQQQVGDLAAGLWYANIHTAQFPGGEIRGQLRRRQ